MPASSPSEFVGDDLKNLPMMASDVRDQHRGDARVRARLLREAADRRRLRDHAAFNMMVPPKVRAHLGGRPLDATEVMSKLKIPVLVTHGAEDRNSKLGTAEYTAKTIPGAKLSVYEGIGHAPFYEDAARFNTELAAFVRGANKTN